MSFDHSKLAVGDPVAYVNGHGLSRNNSITFATVERFTATQIILSGGKRFHRENGRMVGNFYAHLVAHNGPEATHFRVLGVRQRASNALYELQRANDTGSPVELALWLNRIAGVVEMARERLAEIAAAVQADSLLDAPAVAYADDDPNKPGGVR